MATKLLLHCNSSPFVDECGHPVTAAGNAQVSTAQSVFGNSSLLLDGTGDYLSLSDSTDFDLSSGDFTIEAWIRPDLSSDRSVISKRNDTTFGWALEARATGAIWFRANIGGVWSDTAMATAAGTLITNTWAHVALVRRGSSWVIYVNGVSQATLTDAGALSNVAYPLRIGTSATVGESYYSGYLDEVRIIKGEAVYTSNFTPPSQPFFYQDTTFLLPLNGSNAATTFPEVTGKTFAAFGNAQLSTTNPKYGSACLLLDGTGDYIKNTTITSLGAGCWTLEGWFLWGSLPGSVTYSTLIAAVNATGYGCTLYLYNNGASTKLLAYISSTGTTHNIANGVSGTKSSWSTGTYYHIAIVFTGDAYKIYVDGVEDVSTTSSSPVCAITQTYFGSSNGGGDYFNGRMDDLRLTSKIQYTAAFTPPTTAHSYEYATLLIHGNGANGSACVREETGKAVTVAGNAQISTTQSKFGGSALLFDGTGDYLTLADSDDWHLSGDFTIEMWVYPTNLSPAAAYAIMSQSSGSGEEVTLAIDTAGKLYLRKEVSSVGTNVTSTNALSLNTWQHIAVVRSGSTVTFYKNGVANGSGTWTGNSNQSSSLYIGGYWYAGSFLTGRYFYGYLDDIRISKGIALYTADFTPNQSEFTLLGQFWGTISGVVRDDTGAFAARTVRLYRRTTGELVQEMTSNGTTGAYSFARTDANEYYILFLDNDLGTQYNAIVFDRVVPA